MDEAIARLVVLGGEASQKRVHAELVRRGLITTREDGSFIVSEKTVGRRIRELSPKDDVSGPWSYADADPDEARVVLDVVASEFFVTSGRVWPSKAHVAEIARLRKAVPDIPPMWGYQLARAYQICKEQGRDSRHLDFALGVRPWEGVSGADQLARTLGLPRSFKVHRGDGSLELSSSLDLLYELMTFQDSIDEMGSGLESERPSDYAPLPPPEITFVD